MERFYWYWWIWRCSTCRTSRPMLDGPLFLVFVHRKTTSNGERWQERLAVSLGCGDRVILRHFYVGRRGHLQESPAAALRSLALVERETHSSVPLLLIPTDRQLELMLDRRRELCRRTSPYISGCPRCSLCFPWGDDKDDAEVEIVDTSPPGGALNIPCPRRCP